MTIWKFKLDIVDQPSVFMPEDSTPIHVGMQGGDLILWALVDPKSRNVHRSFRVVGTGIPFDDADQWTHVGTVFDGPYVWHVFK